MVNGSACRNRFVVRCSLQARRCFSQALQIQRVLLGPGHPDSRKTIQRLIGTIALLYLAARPPSFSRYWWNQMKQQLSVKA
jgi:hypothetical protein